MSLQSVTRRRSPVQSRAEFTISVIREAGLRILEREGASRLTTNHIAEVAGVSVGSIYQYYPDKYAIVADICNELLMTELGQLEPLAEQTLRLARESLDETLRFIVQGNLGRHRKLYRFLKDYYLEIHWRYNFEANMVDKFPDRCMTTARWLPFVLKRHGADLRIDDHARAAKFVVDIINGTVHASLQHCPESIFDERYAEDLLALVLRYLKNSVALGDMH
ncbi:TetR/AcrR family transcriptional regulator [Denitratisoma oestradiolicum]|uniref:Uncharacterized protein n=1 Tax=Denitratisoma oestradiolicum TaxID=311182 RepID=A0A6S6XXU3_9PROT|nr:TetR/AcrR family transcriptional regulator [Denitratisoma oestradiolicum]TWO81846.1 hypothetical protein CBW56_03855 [Denitratisoma oestradiolicum]CAB1370814.1 conserved protein of unknown function [Denitratisoma oestradiolicum]